MLRFTRKRRRARLLDEGLDPDSWAMLASRVRLLRALDDDARRAIGGITRVLLDEKRFEGCNGFEVTDEVRLVVLAQAALLLRADPRGYFPALRSILVYPGAFVASTVEDHPDGTVTEGLDERLGESSDLGTLVLSWDDVVYDAEQGDGETNVVLHEFAHQLDAITGETNGAPPLGDRDWARTWTEVMANAYNGLCKRVERGEETIIDPYAAEHPSEFFAVTSELHFVDPDALRRAAPEVADQLDRFYGVSGR